MKNRIKEQMISAIRQIEEDDVYALSLFVCDENDNPCRPTVTFGYNTEKQVQETMQDAYDEKEARWNYAFWLQNNLFRFGSDDTADLVKDWLDENNLPFYEDDAAEWDDDDTYETTEAVTQAFVGVMIEIVKELHGEGVLKEKFGKEIPVLIHELEYYDEIAEQNIQANGRKLVEEFAVFCEQ